MISIIVIAVVFLDQLSKYFFRKILLVNQSLPLIKGIFHFTLVYNRGAAFGILKNKLPLFILASLLAIVLIYLNIKKQEKFSLYSVSLALILGGALGNLIDRLFFGYVIDFLDFRIWPVFNLADSAITVGAVLLGYTILVKKDNKC
ncbi:MAG: signal peptidase II [Candidatus Omnitrophica bacterium]|nr:signal peptidase II [Candidatus Omnitrophota bacterium]